MTVVRNVLSSCWRRREVLDELIYLRRTLAAVVKHLGIEVK